ncbi:Spore coat protein CotO [Gracilibacillus orientalis]|uniref:Spore coat protein CotO n=1 Tax=Gracilibacillus orientalis TaxID=334253 RepID=A0A1I4H3M1_9BACI|nr:CotO family spore coat protein [Gracilibacillus orientalis]SFL36390.1 Spore coat protein CotO [Gracilibacillus orientalis]
MDSISEKRELPKLYITQPDLAEPKRSMQSHYHSVSAYDKPQQSQDIPSQYISKKQLENKKFKEMTILEKVIYFASMPFHVPRVKCEIITERKKYVGLIEDYQNEMVIIKVASKPRPVSVPMKQIEEINMVGF